MKLVLLGGNNPRNSAWLDGMKEVLREHFTDIIVHHYSNWKTQQPLIDFDGEIKQLNATLGNKNNVVIIAKSAGALLVLKGVWEKKISPLACVFLGTAILWGREKGFDVDRWVKGFSVPTLFIHKSGDPAIAANVLESLLRESNFKNYNLYVTPGNEHEYSEYQKLSKVIISFLRGRNLL